MMMLALAVGFTACEGDQGEIGPKGDPGAQGEPGALGPQGEPGATEATSFGSVELTISGVDYDGETYSQVLDFKYLADDDIYSSHMYEYEGTDKRHFHVRREYKPKANPNAKTEAISGNRMSLSLSEHEGVIAPGNFYVEAQILHGRKIINFFFAGETYELEDTFTVTDFSYDDATGALKLNFIYSKDELEIKGKVDVIVYHAPLVS